MAQNKEINWMRIIANGGIAFCTTFIATWAVGQDNLEIAAVAAILQGLLAFFTELKIESAQTLAIGLVV